MRSGRWEELDQRAVNDLADLVGVERKEVPQKTPDQRIKEKRVIGKRVNPAKIRPEEHKGAQSRALNGPVGPLIAARAHFESWATAGNDKGHQRFRRRVVFPVLAWVGAGAHLCARGAGIYTKHPHVRQIFVFFVNQLSQRFNRKFTNGIAAPKCSGFYPDARAGVDQGGLRCV